MILAEILSTFGYHRSKGSCKPPTSQLHYVASGMQNIHKINLYIIYIRIHIIFTYLVRKLRAANPRPPPQKKKEGNRKHSPYNSSQAHQTHDAHKSCFHRFRSLSFSGQTPGPRTLRPLDKVCKNTRYSRPWWCLERFKAVLNKTSLKILSWKIPKPQKRSPDFWFSECFWFRITEEVATQSWNVSFYVASLLPIFSLYKMGCSYKSF